MANKCVTSYVYNNNDKVFSHHVGSRNELSCLLNKNEQLTVKSESRNPNLRFSCRRKLWYLSGYKKKNTTSSIKTTNEKKVFHLNPHVI